MAGQASLSVDAARIEPGQSVQETFLPLSLAAHEYATARAAQFPRLLAARGEGLCTHLLSIVSVEHLSLTWVERLVWREDGEKNLTCGGQRECEPQHVVYQPHPIILAARFEEINLLLQGAHMGVIRRDPIDLGSFSSPVRPQVIITPTGGDEWSKVVEGSGSDWVDCRQPGKGYWLTDELAVELGLAPLLQACGPPSTIITFGSFRTNLLLN